MNTDNSIIIFDAFLRRHGSRARFIVMLNLHSISTSDYDRYIKGTPEVRLITHAFDWEKDEILGRQHWGKLSIEWKRFLHERQ